MEDHFHRHEDTPMMATLYYKIKDESKLLAWRKGPLEHSLQSRDGWESFDFGSGKQRSFAIK